MASTSTKTADPTPSSVLVQSFTKKCKTCVSDIGDCWFIVMIDNTLTTQHVVLAEAHPLNEALGNQLFLKFPSWKWSTATQITLVCYFFGFVN